ncbi:MAG TPA: 50S ribosomal protein L32 [Candidatus Babeliales bacterium]|nr:50S ribosomal protein L32 [Candidatus Babeliales bacterium]
MPVPKRKRSRARRDSRFANKGIKVKAISGCLNCKDPIVPHTACKNCGFYKGVKVLATKADRKVKRLAVKAVKTPAKKASDESQAE